MLINPSDKYQKFIHEPFGERTWCSKQLERPPRWCSSDLRDGNQALVNPMDIEKKILLFSHLLKIGFKEIEVAFPSASDTDFNFVRFLIEKNKIPDDVWIQVITQSRESLISKTFESLKGAPRAIVHLYNATAPIFREVVFQQSKSETIDLAVKGARQIKENCEKNPETLWQFEYSPETFCFTERDFSLEICEAVKNIWQPTEDNPMIINLPATVEMSTPNVYADQIEWFIQNFSDLSNITISIHPHNDRGTGVACAELAMLAGATRIEGCLFGNGERTGNVDLVTLALNLYTQGISPRLDFSDIAKTAEIIVHCNELPIHPRHPYAGELVFTAFSGSHQDAIKKGFAKRDKNPKEIWNVPYFIIDPKDLGSNYEEVIRVNSQSGKSGASWLLLQHHGLNLPSIFQVDFSHKVKNFTSRNEKEASIADIWNLFRRSYGLLTDNEYLETPSVTVGTIQGDSTDKKYQIKVDLKHDQKLLNIQGEGNGLLSAFINALNKSFQKSLIVTSFNEHSLGKASNSQAVCYVVIEDKDNNSFFGVSIGDDIARTSIQAVINAFQTVLIKNFSEILHLKKEDAYN